jgi:hypothetical protein
MWPSRNLMLAWFIQQERRSWNPHQTEHVTRAVHP